MSKPLTATIVLSKEELHQLSAAVAGAYEAGRDGRDLRLWTKLALGRFSFVPPALNPPTRAYVVGRLRAQIDAEFCQLFGCTLEQLLEDRRQLDEGGDEAEGAN